MYNKVFWKVAILTSERFPYKICTCGFGVQSHSNKVLEVLFHEYNMKSTAEAIIYGYLGDPYCYKNP